MVALYEVPDISVPRYVRVNILKLDVDFALLELSKKYTVLDACAAPGNKTVHLAALMRRKGRVIACELNKERIKRLKETITLSGASNIEVLNEDFLNINLKAPSYSKVRAILLDPSCSGSGTASPRLDHLLPSKAADLGLVQVQADALGMPSPPGPRLCLLIKD